MDIHKVNASDLTAVTRLVEEVSEKQVLPLLSQQGKEQYRARVLPDLATTLDTERFLAIKAISADGLLGFAALREGNYLTHLFVATSSQGQGVGRELLNYLRLSTRENEISLRASVNAVGFYRRNGFVVTANEGEFNGIRFVPMSTG